MLIRRLRGWEIPEREAAPEAAWVSRRGLLAAAGFLGAMRLRGQGPARRNPKFTLDRPITPEAAATGYNNFFEFDPGGKTAVGQKAERFIIRPWTVEVDGLVAKPRRFDLDDLVKLMPVEERLYRFRCVEAWAMAVPWTGFPLAALVKVVEPRPEAKFVRFVTAHRPGQMPGIGQSGGYQWPYCEGLRMDEAMNPLTLAATGLYGKPLPKQNGAPLRIVAPWKYGFKSIKSIVRIEFTSKRPRTFWNGAQPGEYGFYANVDPARAHPRWPQTVERLIPAMEERPTLPYNGYARWVAGMYNGGEI
jgi:sulfoxide reductase catalytic subunit YedY